MISMAQKTNQVLAIAEKIFVKINLQITAHEGKQQTFFVDVYYTFAMCITGAIAFRANALSINSKIKMIWMVFQ